MSSSNKILQIYKSRLNILSILETFQNYNTSNYNDFSINEIDAMYTNNQLDMLIQHKTDNKKTYIKYYLTSKQIRPQNLDNIIDDLFNIENVLSKDDTLIIIIEEEPNDTIITKLEYLYNHDGIFVVIHNIQRLQFNILEHKLVPEMTILNSDETNELMKQYNLSSLNQLPEISRFDPVALALSMRPGQVGKIVRGSITALLTKFYRVCV